MKRSKIFCKEVIRIVTILTMVFFLGLYSEVQGQGHPSPSEISAGQWWEVDADLGTAGFDPFVIPEGTHWTIIKVALSVDAGSVLPSFRLYNNTSDIFQLDAPGDSDTLEDSIPQNLVDVLWISDGNPRVFTLKLDFNHYYSSGLPANVDMYLEVKNNDTAPRTFFVGIGHSSNSDYTAGLAEATANASISWIQVTSEPINFGEVLIGGVKPGDQTITIANVGTGDFNVIGLPVLSHDPFDLSLVCTNPLEPQDTCDIKIGFDPKHPDILGMADTLGPITPTPTITINNDSDNEPNLSIDLWATAVQLELGLLFDISGSMGYPPDGCHTSSDQFDTRLYLAKLAGEQMFLLLKDLEGHSARVALFTFPKYDGTCSEAGLITPFRSFALNEGALEDAFGTDPEDSLQPDNSTPMAKGLETAYGIPPDNFGGVGNTKWTLGDYIRRALILFTDGAHNCPNTTNGSGAYDHPEDWVSIIQGATGDPPDPERLIKVYTIGYYVEGDVSVNRTILKDLAEAGQGEHFDANVSDPTDLANSFREALVQSRQWIEIEDPLGDLTKGGGKKYHDVCIDDSVDRIAFVVDWEKVSANAIDFVLQGPNGIISDSSPDVSFYSRNTYAMYIVTGDTAKGNKGSDQWRFVLNGGSGLNNGENLKYRYTVIGKSRVKIDTKPVQHEYYTGLNRVFEVKIDGINNDWKKSATVTLNYDIPAESLSTWLSSTKRFKTEWFASTVQNYNSAGSLSTAKYLVPEKIMNEPANRIQQKAFALKHFAGRPFKNKRMQGVIQLYDNGENGDRKAGDGIYSNIFSKFMYDGLARFGIVFQKNSGDDCIKQEFWNDSYISVNLDPKSLGNDLTFEKFKILPLFPKDWQYEPYAKPGMLRGNIVFTPKDEFGNYWGPGHAKEVKFFIKNDDEGIRFIGPVIDNLDGSYIQVIEYNKGITPIVAVKAGKVSSGDTIMKSTPSSAIGFGVKLGMNFANLSNSQSLAPSFEWNNRTSFAAAAYLSFKLSESLYFQPGGAFTRKGLKVDFGGVENTFNIDFLELPLLLKYRLSKKGGWLSPNIFGGLFGALKVGDNVSSAAGVSDIKTIDGGIVFGGGFEMNMGGNILTLETRYTMGLIDISKDSGFTVKSKVLSFMIGLEF